MLPTIGSSQSTNVSLLGESSTFKELGLDLAENGKLPTTRRDVVQAELVTGVFNIMISRTAMEKAAAVLVQKLSTFQQNALFRVRTQQSRTLSGSNIAASAVRKCFHIMLLFCFKTAFTCQPAIKTVVNNSQRLQIMQ